MSRSIVQCAAPTTSWACLALVIFGSSGCDSMMVTGSSGTLESTIGDGAASEADARILNVRLESEKSSDSALDGTGLEVEYWLSDDDLFGNSTKVRALELTPYLLFGINFGKLFRTPLRLGATYQHLTLDPKGSSSTKRITLGLKGALEPELDLVRGTKGALTLYGKASYLVGIMAIKNDDLETDSFDGDSTTLGLEAGIKYSRDDFEIGLGLMRRRFDSGDTETETGAAIPSLENEYDGIALYLRLGF